ncbi:MAG: 6-phosphogluconolactonase [Chlamydiae bacterium]|nr:6-phosphogluconolactonase [Chlamydiota bacterium]
MLETNLKFCHFDQRRDVVVPGDTKQTLKFCVDHFLNAYEEAIKSHGNFYVALSGGSTPKAIFKELTSSPIKEKLDWSKIHLFWSDERSVGPNDPDSNYHMAMEAGFSAMPIPKENIHRMHAEEDIEHNAGLYETVIRTITQGHLDYTMLGMGEDGHTASLFPATGALNEELKLVTKNWVPQKNTWRMTFTYTCINKSKHIVIYVLGAAKKVMLKSVLTDEKHFTDYPIVKVGTKSHKALWICDTDAAQEIKKRL